MLKALRVLCLLLLTSIACSQPQDGARRVQSGADPQVMVETPTPCDKCGDKEHPRPATPVPTPTRPRGAGVGQEAPDFGLPSLKGGTVHLSDYRGQVVLLNFWATWCGFCRVEMPSLVAAQQRYGKQGFVVLAVDLGEGADQVAGFASQYGMEFPVLLDQEGATMDLYPTRGIPMTLILDREGVVRYAQVGMLADEDIRRQVEPLLGSVGS